MPPLSYSGTSPTTHQPGIFLDLFIYGIIEAPLLRHNGINLCVQFDSTSRPALFRMGWGGLGLKVPTLITLLFPLATSSHLQVDSKGHFINLKSDMVGKGFYE